MMKNSQMLLSLMRARQFPEFDEIKTLIDSLTGMNNGEFVGMIPFNHLNKNLLPILHVIIIHS
jgi:hypothetical protein